MPSPAPTIRKSNRTQKKRIISDPSCSPIITTTKKVKSKHVRPKSVAIDVSLLDNPASENPVLPDGSSSESSVSEHMRNVYDSYSRKDLHHKWMQSKDLVDSEIRKNSILSNEIKDKDKKLLRVNELEEKLAVSKLDLAASKLEQKGLVESITNLKRTYTILGDSKKSDKANYDANLKLKLATQASEHSIILCELKLKFKEKDLEAIASQSEVRSLKTLLSIQESKAKKFDDYSLQSLKSHVQMKDVHDKASLR